MWDFGFTQGTWHIVRMTVRSELIIAVWMWQHLSGQAHALFASFDGWSQHFWSAITRCEALQLHVQVSLVQADNFAWFGYPDDPEPSARNFLPGLVQVLSLTPCMKCTSRSEVYKGFSGHSRVRRRVLRTGCGGRRRAALASQRRGRAGQRAASGWPGCPAVVQGGQS